MFVGEYILVKTTRNQGTSKTGQNFDIGKITISDGLESFELDINPELIPAITYIKKGDKVNVSLTPENTFRGVRYIITNVLPVPVK